MTEIKLRPLMTFCPLADAQSAYHIGDVPMGYARRVTFVTGGTFEGRDPVTLDRA